MEAFTLIINAVVGPPLIKMNFKTIKLAIIIIAIIIALLGPLFSNGVAKDFVRDAISQPVAISCSFAG